VGAALWASGDLQNGKPRSDTHKLGWVQSSWRAEATRTAAHSPPCEHPETLKLSQTDVTAILMPGLTTSLGAHANTPMHWLQV
jgi:hypothetical protein